MKASVLTALAMCVFATANAQTLEERIAILEGKVQTMSDLENKMQKMTERQKYQPQIHGILRGKYEYQPDLDASRFEVRNARLSAEGNLPYRSSYKLEVDLCDESAIKMKDAWVRIALSIREERGEALRITFGQQRMPFSIDAHRNPSAQYFANRSFIAKQVGDMRDVGAAIGYDFITSSAEGGKKGGRKILSIDAGLYNGSNLDNQKTAWFTCPAYSARVQYFPVKGVAIIPSVQHQLIANREASYTSFDFGAYYEKKGLHLEAEYLRKHYSHDAFDDCNAVNAMAIYSHPMKKEKTFIQGISYLLRYDYMDNHSDGKKGFDSQTPDRLVQSDAQRHRMTVGTTFHVRNPYFPTDIRLNYEKYWYPNNGTPKESEQDKLVCELMIRF